MAKASRPSEERDPREVADSARRAVRSMARNLRLRLEDEARAGLSAWPRGHSASLMAGGSSVGGTRTRLDKQAVAPGKAAEAPPAVHPPSPVHAAETRAAEALRGELEARAGAAAGGQDVLDFGSPDLEGGVGREEALARIAAEVAGCDRCPALLANRTHTVPGQGSAYARLVFVGEGPGEEEDRQGLAFVGRAGQLLTKMIEAIGMTREEVFICNILKCRAPGNRTPSPEESANCMPYLARQLEVVRPKVLCALGGVAAQALLGTHDGITRLRGRFYPYKGSRLIPTFHPAYVLRNYTPDTRKKVYEDLLKAKAALEGAAEAE